ncbi:MAG: prepilin-type N-terminal cleavage/methylation domain-containing protein, partial [Planctomycetales bacterium]|nr:prepilin-type N-terminal cleavage/methylation domain-containing protein [Planctomycetales bacterium]
MARPGGARRWRLTDRSARSPLRNRNNGCKGGELVVILGPTKVPRFGWHTAAQRRSGFTLVELLVVIAI